MRYAFISDIHANLSALQAVLDHLKDQQIDQFICLGDIVGYGHQPNECVDIIKKLKCPTLLGNHDSVASGLEDSSRFNLKAQEAIHWTQEQLNKTNIRYLKNLPYTYKNDIFFAVHASPIDPPQWNYVLTFDAAREAMLFFSEQICFIGHSHVPFFFEWAPNGVGELIRDNPMHIKKGHRYLVNVGSVGQPRDKNPKSAFVVLDEEEKTITLKRVSFDIGDETRAGEVT